MRLVKFVPIALTRGHFAIVDETDAESVAAHCWHLVSTPDRVIAAAASRIGERRVYMHHLLIGEPRAGQEVDHINGDPLDNRRSNLRVTDRRGNGRNLHPAPGAFKGIYWRKDTNRWTATINPDRRSVSLGCFDRAEDAARAYDEGARRLFGQFACVNFPTPEEAALQDRPRLRMVVDVSALPRIDRRRKEHAQLRLKRATLAELQASRGIAA